MKAITVRSGSTLTPAVFLVCCLLTLPLGSPALCEEPPPEPQDDVIIVGAQDDAVDADENRDAKYERNREIPGGAVLDYFQWSTVSSEGKNWLQVKAWDASQLDERASVRAGIGNNVRLFFDYQSTPHRFGDGARSVLGRGATDGFGQSLRIADFVQQNLQDPNGDGTFFYDEYGGSFPGAPPLLDDPAVVSLMNQLFEGQDRFSLSTRRRTGRVGARFLANENWTLDIDASHETRDGRQALGSGTYQRITDVNDNLDGTYGDGDRDYDYFFDVRGIELQAPVDYRTTRFTASANYQARDWFVRVAGTASEFENEYLGLTYDNPFWFDDRGGTGGNYQRGLWEEGRASLEPSNEAWDFTVSGGVNLPRRTRITAAASLGRHTQDERFLPITTNAASGSVDLNDDGVLDDPTMPVFAPFVTTQGTRTIGTDLGGESDITAFNLSFVTRPVKQLDIRAGYRSYSYEGDEGILAIPARTEYIESNLVTTFKGDEILHVPLDFTRDTVNLSAGWRFSNAFKLVGFAKRKSYDYDQYVDSDGNSSRDKGGRAVSGTDDDIIGLTGMFAYSDWLSGRATLQTADREYDGKYTPAFSGENPDVRQYDIANRERDAVDLQFDFMPDDAWTFGVGFRFYDDDYPDSLYGLQKGESQGVDVNLTYTSPSGVSFFAYADVSEWDGDMHLRTKCANCDDPAVGSWTVPNFDWFSDYTDTTTAVGAGVSFDTGTKTRVDIQANWTDGQIEQATRNPATPLEGDPGNPRTIAGEVATVALGFDFPDQQNTLVAAEIRLTHRINKKVSAGLWWLFEDFELDDFQWDGLDPYGPNAVDIRVPGSDEIGDNATRYLFLDSRYQDYTANVVQVFVKILL